MDPLSSLYKLARKNMVVNQLKPHSITNPKIIEAFLSIARERFVPPAYYNLCYYDHEVKLNGGRVLLSPVTLARLLQQASLIPGQKALIVGGSTGYSAAILSLCGVSCYMVESENSLYEHATHLLASFENVQCLSGDITKGWAEHAPYDIILIDGGAVPCVPYVLLEQLNPAGGKLFAMRYNPSEVNNADTPLCQAICVERIEATNLFQNSPTHCHPRTCSEDPEILAINARMTNAKIANESPDRKSTETRILFECSVSVNLKFAPKDSFVF